MAMYAGHFWLSSRNIDIIKFLETQLYTVKLWSVFSTETEVLFHHIPYWGKLDIFDSALFVEIQNVYSNKVKEMWIDTNWFALHFDRSFILIQETIHKDTQWCTIHSVCFVNNSLLLPFALFIVCLFQVNFYCKQQF